MKARKQDWEAKEPSPCFIPPSPNFTGINRNTEGFGGWMVEKVLDLFLYI